MKPNTAQAAIYQAALSLFAEHGWQKISVETLCAAAQTSRVTFYKYYADKRDLLCQILMDDKNRIRAALSDAQENAESLAEIITLLLDLQKQSLQTVYTPPVLRDIQQSKDKVLQDFFAEMYAEKDRFMHDFFYYPATTRPHPHRPACPHDRSLCAANRRIGTTGKSTKSLRGRAAKTL